jgi:hypothetical protein
MICSELHRTPREARKYSAIASRNGRYPRPSSSVLNHDLKFRARSAAMRPQSSDGNSIVAGFPMRKGRTPAVKARPTKGFGRLYPELTRRI